MQYEYHVGKSFDTTEGKAITKELSETARRFNLTEQFGVAPQGASPSLSHTGLF